MTNSCETCIYYQFDDEYEENVCTMNLDEDEMMRFMTYGAKACPYFRFGDDYTIVKSQN